MKDLLADLVWNSQWKSSFNLLHDIEVRDQLTWRTSHPILFVSHHRDVRSQFTNSGRLQKCTNSCLEVYALHNIEKGFDLSGCQPRMSFFQCLLSHFVWNFFLHWQYTHRIRLRLLLYSFWFTSIISPTTIRELFLVIKLAKSTKGGRMCGDPAKTSTWRTKLNTW